MDEINPEFIERYQLLYEQNPKSKIFAPLAEAYRKMGLTKEALEIAESGVSIHPSFAGGHVALGKVLLDLQRLPEATQALQKAADLAPENIMAQSTLADLLLKQKDPKGALKAYKMLLFLQPENQRAQKAVRKLESLTADEYEPDIFAMQPLRETVRQWDGIGEETRISLNPNPVAEEGDKLNAQQSKSLERLISLADAFLVRNDVDRAQEAMEEAERQFGQHPEIIKRFRLLNQRHLAADPEPAAAPVAPPKNRGDQAKEDQVAFLKKLLTHFRQARTSRISE
ncbi:MAG: tetratricopeptide repeat protein [Bdellovibrionales bacterium]|nr:tetratricopeptide repeat protein [Bdellovibrionales bacterium]